MQCGLANQIAIRPCLTYRRSLIRTGAQTSASTNTIPDLEVLVQSTPNSVATRVVTRSATDGFNIGLDKSSGSTPSFVFSPAVFTTSNIIFLVGSYTFNSGSTTDDVSQLWINPPPSTFGQASPPVAALTN